MKIQLQAIAAFSILAVAVSAVVAARQFLTIEVPIPRTAVALEFVVERDADGKVIKIHRFILWSDGSVTFPNLPYYASLRLNCRECPKVKNTCPEDIDGDGVVAIPDLLLLNAAMGKKCP